MPNDPDNEPLPMRRLPWAAFGLLLLACALIAHEEWFTVRPETSRARRGRNRSGRMPRRTRTQAPRILVATDFSQEKAEGKGGGPAAPESAPSAEAGPNASDGSVAFAAFEPREDVLLLRELALGRIVCDRSDPDASFAEIGGRAVRAGEEVGGHLVHRVEPDHVRLGAEGEFVLVPRER